MKLLPAEALVGSEKGGKLREPLLLPAGEGESIRFPLHRFDDGIGRQGHYLRRIVKERGRPVGQGMREFRPEPIQDGHEVVADDFHSGPREPCERNAVILDIAIAARPSQLDVLMDIHALDHLERQTARLGLILQAPDAVNGPRLADGYIV